MHSKILNTRSSIRYIGKRVHGHADTDTYGKDGQLWKRRAIMEKMDTYGKDGHLWKRRTQSI